MSPSAPAVGRSAPAVGRSAGALVVLALVVACGAPPPPEWHEAEGHRWRELRVPDDGGPGFTPLPAGETGIGFSNGLDAERGLENEHLLIGSGVALGDVDGDGRTDVYLARLQGPNALYRNLGGWTFEDVTREAGVAAGDRYSTGAAMADVDGDGDLDLVVTSLGGPDVVFRNDGGGRFTEADAGLEPGLGSSTVALADVDGDGDLDLYRTAYKSESASDELRMFERPLSELEEDVVVRRGDSLAVAPDYREHYRIEERRGRKVVVEQAEPDRLYLNDGDGRFEPVSWTGGAFRDARGRPLEREIDDFGLAARFHDVNGDGRPDLYVCNDFHDPDRLWINRGDGTFRASFPLALRKTPHASMSVDFADVQGDGAVDVFVAEMETRDMRRRLLEIPLRGPFRKPPGSTTHRPQVQRNTLFLNRGDGTFAEIAELAGVEASEWTWASMFLDVDLDGRPDLLAANGYSRDIQHGGVAARITRLQSGGGATTRELKRLYPELETRNAAFRNRGDLTFRDVGTEWGVGTEPDISHGMASGDLDGDGDRDVVINRLGRRARVLRNDAAGGRVAVRLRDDSAGGRGVGAEVRLVGEGVPDQEKQTTAGGLYLSGSAPGLTFATGEADSMTLVVSWPGGGRTVVDGVRPDRLYEVRRGSSGRGRGGAAATPGGRDGEGEGPAGAGVGTGAPAADGGDGSPLPLFRDRSELLDHRHREREFEDYRRQPLLPYQPSRLGPGVSWIDVDADGDPDLVVPPAAGGPASYLRNDGGSFREVALEPAGAPLDRTAAVALPGGDGRPVIAMGQSSFEASTEEEVRSAAAALVFDPGAGRSGPTRLAGSGLTAAGPLATADVEGDGDLDLFVGGRIVKGGYPVPATSRLFLREGGELRPDPGAADVLEEIGLVSGVVFSDVDVDGDPDLLLALEWGPVRLLVNEGGRFRDATTAWGLEGLAGRWNGITTGDLDGDGDMDGVVTGWGRNVEPRPRPDRPLVLFTGDFDRNGSWDLFPTVVSPERDAFLPLEPWERVRKALPSIRSRISGHEAYAGASLEEILGRPPGEAFRLVARRYEHLVLWNRGGRLEPARLPLAAQLAPATGVAVGDMDGDGREDVFLSQNFYPVAPDRARHDAGLGLLLLGDGDGGLDPVPAARSGIRLHGDQRGAALADVDGDARVDLAVAQNGGPTRLFRNRGARPGLRVRLRGPAGNPGGTGARIRVLYGDGRGPAREVHGGSGYWSMDARVQVMGLASEPEAVEVRWPGGGRTRAPVPRGAREITVRQVDRGDTPGE